MMFLVSDFIIRVISDIQLTARRVVNVLYIKS